MPAAQNRPIPAPDVDVDVVETVGKPASWPGRRANRLRPSSREIKMLRQTCQTCADRVGGKKYLPPAWQESCEHDPYVTIVMRPEQQTVYEDVMETVTHTVTKQRPVLNDDGEPKKGPGGRIVTEDYEEEVSEERPTGAKKVVGVETVLIPTPTPNWVSITHAGGVNKGRGVERALRRGYIYPQQLRSPIWPTGIKRRCQFRECMAEDLKRYANGWFCRPEEAALVRISDTSESFQVDFDERSGQFQRDQIDANKAKVGAGVSE